MNNEELIQHIKEALYNKDIIINENNEYNIQFRLSKQKRIIMYINKKNKYPFLKRLVSSLYHKIMFKYYKLKIKQYLDSNNNQKDVGYTLLNEKANRHYKILQRYNCI